MTDDQSRGTSGSKPELLRKKLRGIVVSEGKGNGHRSGPDPRISAFVWGGRVRPAPTLPFGRWGSAP
jgi:hypothetical protein